MLEDGVITTRLATALHPYYRLFSTHQSGEERIRLIGKSESETRA